MNRETTKVIWIGRKKHSTDKLKVSVNLDWGKSEFVLLGISFNVDLAKMPETNLNSALNKAETQLKNWNVRRLSPIGKITVLKSLILSKFIHIFLVLPVPENFIRKLNTLFFQFLWNNKPNKIKRATICGNYSKGALKMVNVCQFIKLLKITWIRRIFFQTDCQWLILF